MSSVQERVGDGGARKGRPRDERIDDEITTAALDVLADDGFDRFSVEAVASRCGVAKTTVYRRFPTRDGLVAGALGRLNDDLAARAADGPWREQLNAVLTAIRRAPGSTRGRILMHAAAEGARDPALAELVHDRVLAPRQAVLRTIIRQGMDSGDLREDLDVDAVVPLLVGPMLHLGTWRMCRTSQAVDVEAVVDLLLTGLTRASDS